MKLFVYEFVIGGGMWGMAGSMEPVESLLAEGKAMAEAVIEDLTSAGHQASAMLDARLQGRVSLACEVEIVANARQEESAFQRLAQVADATLLIAPEIGGALLERCRRVEESGCRLISPASPFVAIAADKQTAAERLFRQGVPTPPGVRICDQPCAIESHLFPAVLKPCDGAGSWLVRRVENEQQLQQAIQSPEYQLALKQSGLRLERIVPGMAASVAVLCGPAGTVPLAPCEQLLGGEGFDYLGGRLPLASPLAERARSLAVAAVCALPQTVGYVGVDLILGAASDGSEDYVIEINPRLTTSYVGLRAACRQNLAAAMLSVADGRPPALSFDAEPLEFRADGTVWRPSGFCT